MIRKKTAMASKFVLNEMMKGTFQFTLYAPDDQLLLTSPFFTDKERALNRINAVRTLARRDRNIVVSATADGRFYILLMDNKGVILGKSGTFIDEQSLQKGIDSLKRSANASRLLDLTQQGRAAFSPKNKQSSRTAQKETVTTSRIILIQNVTGQYSFTFRAIDGQLLLTSISFPDKDTALHGIELTRSLAQTAQHYQIRSAGGGQYYFELKNSEGEMLGRSTVYPDGQSLEKGIDLLKNYSKPSRLLDLTGGK